MLIPSCVVRADGWLDTPVGLFFIARLPVGFNHLHAGVVWPAAADSRR